MKEKPVHGVCVATRGTDVVVVPTCDRRLLEGVVPGTYPLVSLLEPLTANKRGMTKWEKGLRDELLATCADAEVIVGHRILTIRPLHFCSAAEQGALVGAIAITVRRLLTADDWHIVSQACGEVAA